MRAPRRRTQLLGRLVGVALAILAPPIAARGESARELLDRARSVNDAREPEDVTERMRMTIVDSRGGERVRELEVRTKSYGHRKKKGVTFFVAPPDVRGVGFLVWTHPDADDDQWLYLPELKRVRRITGATRRQSFQGSDFTYEDLELFDRIRDWTEAEATSRLVAEREIEDGVPCAVIELVPHDKDIEYGRFVLWLDRDDWTTRKLELYDAADGALRKTVTLGGYETLDGIPTAKRVVMANPRKGTRTVMELSDVRYNRGLADELFTEQALERGRSD